MGGGCRCKGLPISSDNRLAIIDGLLPSLITGYIHFMGNIRNNRNGFSLVEIMVVVTIVGLLAALAVPAFVKARKRCQGNRILNDCRQMDAAIDQWTVNAGMPDGTIILTWAAATYLKTGWNTV